MRNLQTTSIPSYSIAPYSPGDDEGVAAVAAAVQFDRQPPENRSGTGYLVLARSASEYQWRLPLCACTRVAKRDGHVAGFLLAYHRVVLEQLRQADPADPLLKAALADSAEPVFLVDQIAVEPASAGLGVAGQLYNAFRAAAGGGIGYASIMHATVRNERSRRFFTQWNHWQEAGSYRTKSYEWGIYRGVL